MGFYFLIAILTVALTNGCHGDRPALPHALRSIVQTLYSLINPPKSYLKSRAEEDTYFSQQNAYAKADETNLGTIERYLANTRIPATASLVDSHHDSVSIQLDKKGQAPLLLTLKLHSDDNEQMVVKEEGINKYPLVLNMGKERYPITLKVTTDEDEAVDIDDEGPFPVVKLTTRDDETEDHIKLTYGDATWPVLKLIKAEDTPVENPEVLKAKAWLESGGDEKSSPINAWRLSNRNDDEVKSKDDVMSSIPDGMLSPLNKDRLRIVLNIRKNDEGTDEHVEGEKKRVVEDDAELYKDVQLAKLIKDKIKKSKISG